MKRWLIFLITILPLSLMPGSALGAPPTPQTPPAPPLPPAPPPIVEETTGEEFHALELPPLKAVLIVGPIDGDYGDWTTEEKQHMDLAAAELAANSVTVTKFYTPNNDWEQIKAAARGAHFLLYRGHGVYWSPLPHPTVGGFALKDRFVSPDDIRNDLELAPNAIVMLYACFSAGSSSIEGDVIDSAEAQRRVAQYSDPFFDVGAAGYYANWYGNAFQMFVRYLFQGKTLGQAYESYFDFDPATVERHTHPDHPMMAMWLDKDFWWGAGNPAYDNAFVGLPNKKLEDLFYVTRMRLTPPALIALVELGSSARTYTVRVTSTSPDSFTWTATPSASWIKVQPTSGSSGQAMTVTLSPGGKGLGTYQGSIHITATSTSPNPVLDGDQTIPVTLQVVEQVHATYLPVVTR